VSELKGSVYFRSLGCPKNQVDSEVMLGNLALGDYAIAESIDDADVAVINTCSFIESAREESIEAILELAELRESGDLRGLIVAGCLPQRYPEELARELPEVDAFVGTSEFTNIARILDDALAGRRGGVYVDAGRTHLYDEAEPRLLIGPTHSAYVKIAEGCDRRCAFCAIPAIRGRFQSRTLASVVAEARQLAAGGAREIHLVSQDTCAWGNDLPGRPRLAELVRALDEVEELDWIRLHYLYPSAVTDDLIDAIAGAARVLPYIDVPLQHASDAMLRAMRRGTTAARQRALVAKLRERIPHVTLRTTFIVGFPGETESDFAKLREFVRESRFERAGLFRYSDEEGTAAAELPDKVPARTAQRRYRELAAVQADIMREALEARVGEEVRVLVDRSTGPEVRGAGRARGRLASQAPEVDGCVRIASAAPVGEFARVRLTGVRDVDLEGALVSAPAASVPAA
jgi:ribosomal protein S12 methylthiotransferase